ncbi:uncharacterized protein V6R79_026463 [Siganus canaliculatus]
MQQTLLLLLLMGSIVSSHHIKYHFVENEKSWKEAQSYCREKYTDLATVSDMEDMEDMKKLHEAAGGRKSHAWIGLYNDSKTEKFVWRWVQPGVVYNDSEANWVPPEPNNSGGNEHCVMVREKREWNDIDCDTSYAFICYDETNSEKKYHLVNEVKSWSKAQQFCRKSHTGLVSGRAQLEEAQKLVGTSNIQWFIGLFRDTWVWSDNSSFLFRNWTEYPSPADPGSCAVTMLDKEGKWKRENCEKEKSFFCLDDNMILIKQNMSWDKALEYCREHHNDLVSIITPEDQKWVQERAKEATSSHVWLGLRYVHILDFWFWVSNEAVEFENWAPDGGEENHDVSGAMERGGEHKWFKKDDEDEFNFICSKE